jgi:hypothetical protein
VRSLLNSIFGLFAYAVLIGIFAFWIGARGGSTIFGWLAVASVLGLMLLIGPIFVLKRAVGRAVVHLLSTRHLGRRVSSLLFEQLLRAKTTGVAGARGSLLQRGVEQLPLAEVERRLEHIVVGITGQLDGFLVARVERALLQRVGTVTLSALRAEGDYGGGVDLVKVCERLACSIDNTLIAQVESALTATTLWCLLLLSLGGIGIAFMIGR